MELPSFKTLLAVSTVAVVAVVATAYLTTSSDSKPRKQKSVTKKKQKRSRKKFSTNLTDSAICSDIDPEATPENLAKEAKSNGNALFAEKNFEEAIKSYTVAIELDAQSVFYNNRAACHVHLKDYALGLYEFLTIF
jgi:tetratricopeptide (TPR) repeat protein